MKVVWKSEPKLSDMHFYMSPCTRLLTKICVGKSLRIKNMCHIYCGKRKKKNFLHSLTINNKINKKKYSMYHYSKVTDPNIFTNLPASYEGGGLATSNRTWLESISLSLNLVKSIPYILASGEQRYSRVKEMKKFTINVRKQFTCSKNSGFF